MKRMIFAVIIAAPLCSIKAQTAKEICDHDAFFTKCVQLDYSSPTPTNDMYYWLTGDGHRVEGGILDYCYEKPGVYEARLFKNEDSHATVTKSVRAFDPILMGINVQEQYNIGEPIDAKLILRSESAFELQGIEWYLNDVLINHKRDLTLNINESGDHFLESYAHIELNGYGVVLCSIAMLEVQ